MDVIRKRMGGVMPLRFDLIGLCSILADDAGQMLQAVPTGPQAADTRCGTLAALLLLAGTRPQLPCALPAHRITAHSGASLVKDGP